MHALITLLIWKHTPKSIYLCYNSLTEQYYNLICRIKTDVTKLLQKESRKKNEKNRRPKPRHTNKFILAQSNIMHETNIIRIYSNELTRIFFSRLDINTRKLIYFRFYLFHLCISFYLFPFFLCSLLMAEVMWNRYIFYMFLWKLRFISVVNAC